MAAKVAVKKKDGVSQRPVAPYPKSYKVLRLVVTLLAFATRFWRLDKPSEVVFDEVHFGKFASHYLQREYYFDLHPPLAKMLIALVGYLAGYNGAFKFDNIGDSYITNNVPYVTYRTLSASLGTATVPLVFSILELCGCSPAACFLGASLLVFDTAQIAQTRLILLDSTLIFALALSLYFYVRFSKARNAPFSVKWWAWLIATGFALSCSISTKYVGLFVFLTVGSAVLVDLYNLYDVRGKKNPLSLASVGKQFAARFGGLIVWPFILYLFWFWIHFRVLINSGPGDGEMSPEFQETLLENPLAKEALSINFYDVVTIQSLPKSVYLHSHPEHYPLQYEDGRVSSQGQQVTGYTHVDPNNNWQILPELDMPEGQREGIPVVGSQLVRFRHVLTNTYLLTHDVASPGFPTNEEFTTVSPEVAYGEGRYDTLFYLDAFAGQTDIIQTKMTQFRLKHEHTKVGMWLSDGPLLPEWGHGQFEINGNKQATASGTAWFFGDIVGLSDEEREERKLRDDDEIVPRRPFWKDYLELQHRMFRSNNMLTATHPYMSSPISWPFMTRGISFWTGKDQKSQIYLVGNFVGWYLEIFGFILFLVTILIDQLTYLRDAAVLSSYERQKLYRTALWFFGGWAFHYFPFFLMGRQLFLHHYLPAHLLGALVLPTTLDILTGQFDRKYRETSRASRWSTVVIVAVMTAGLLWGFVFWGPLAYGLPLSPERVVARQWLNIDLHFNKVV